MRSWFIITAAFAPSAVAMMTICNPTLAFPATMTPGTFCLRLITDLEAGIIGKSTAELLRQAAAGLLIGEEKGSSPFQRLAVPKADGGELLTLAFESFDRQFNHWNTPATQPPRFFRG